MAPMDFESTTTTADSITFQWIPLTDQQANGMVRQYTITCNDTAMVRMLQVTTFRTFFFFKILMRILNIYLYPLFELWYVLLIYTTFNIQANVTGPAIMGTVSGLDPFTDYSCTIFATTVADGPVSDPFVVRTAEGGVLFS